jgi:large subunit ribosomal protein L9
MKVILTASVSNLGQIGEVIEVKNGYAKNFLIPSKKAICFTPTNQKLFEVKRAEFEQANENNLKDAKKLKDKLAGKDIVVIESASDDGRLYGSVNSSVIATKVNDVIGSKAVSRASVFLRKPIKEIGVYSVRLDLHSDINLDVRLIVTRSESEIEALLKAAAKAEKAAKNSDKEEVVAVEEIPAAETSEEKPAKKARKKKSEAAE